MNLLTEGLAAAARVLKTYDAKLAQRCLNAAVGLWHQDRKLKPDEIGTQIKAAVVALYYYPGVE